MDQTDYQKLVIQRLPARAIRETPEGKYWSKFRDPVDIQQVGAVTSIDFCPTFPYPLAVSSSTRVLIYDSKSRKLRRTLSRFKDKAYSGSFRADGRAIVAGGEDSVVYILDTGSRTVLRSLTGHQRAVHVTRYAPDKLHVLSGGDDATVRWWDVSQGQQLLRLDGHQDYVRSSAVSPANSDLWATGAYDHTCRVWDVRGSQEVFTVDHGAPIEDLVFFPTGAMLATAGGTDICLWDMVGGGRLLHRISSHQKTVTAVRITPTAGPASSTGPRLLSGSLDGHVKVFELDSFGMTHAYKFPEAVLSLGISLDASTLAVGLSNGMLSLRKHPRPKLESPPGAVAAARRAEGPQVTAANYRYFLRGRREPAGMSDARIAAQKQARLKPVDKFLKAFHYHDAVDAALRTTQPEVVISLFDELSLRAGLGAAIGGRDADGLLPLLDFLVKYLPDPRYSTMLIGITNIVLDIYAPALGTSAEVDVRIVRLQNVVMREMKFQDDLEELQGLLEPLLATSLSGAQDVARPQTPPLALEGPLR